MCGEENERRAQLTQTFTHGVGDGLKCAWQEGDELCNAFVCVTCALLVTLRRKRLKRVAEFAARVRRYATSMTSMRHMCGGLGRGPFIWCSIHLFLFN